MGFLGGFGSAVGGAAQTIGHALTAPNRLGMGFLGSLNDARLNMGARSTPYDVAGNHDPFGGMAGGMGGGGGYRPPPGYGFQNAYANAQAQNLPVQTQLNNQYGSIQQQSGLQQQQFGLQEQGLNANSGFDNRSLDVRQQQLGLDRSAQGRQDPLLQARLGMAQQARGYLDVFHQGALANIDQSSAYEAFKNKTDARGRGAMGSEGLAMDQQNIGDRAKFARTEETFGRLGYNNRVLNADDDIRSAAENISKNKDNGRQLDIQAKQYGIDRERLASNLQLGMQRLGLDRTMSLNDVFDKLNSNRVDYQMLGQKIMDQALQMTPIFQSANYLPPVMQAALGGKK